MGILVCGLNKAGRSRPGRRMANGERPVPKRAAEIPDGGGYASVWCFGDSNTGGYDPRGFLGGRYAAPWPELLAEKTGLRVIPDGENGRMIPRREEELLRFRRDAARSGADVLVVMLGTNDLLSGAGAGKAEARMEAFLRQCGMPHILLVAPPPLRRGAWVPDDGLVAESAELSVRYRHLAARMGVRFADAGEWGIGLAFDGVHFSEEGHVRFADGIASALRALPGRDGSAAARTPCHSPGGVL